MNHTSKMPRAHTVLQNEFPYHVTGRCINREWFASPLEEVWKIMSNHLFYVRHALNGRIHAFVLMPNHYHLLISTPDSNLSQIMAYFMKSTSADLTRANSRINQSYGSRHFRCIIESQHYYLHAYKYVYRNPVKAGLSKVVESYPYSTLTGLLGFRHMYIPLEEDSILFDDVEGTLKWLNLAPAETEWESVRRAIKKRTFKLGMDSASNKPSHLEAARL